MSERASTSLPPTSPAPSAVSTEWLLRPEGRPLFVFAHQDDETVLAGMIRRMLAGGDRGAFVWWTNGDGLAPEAGVEPARYARIRIAEATESMRRLGASEKRKTDLETSEIENYRRFTHVSAGGRLRTDALDYFRNEADRVEEAVRAADPDRVFVLAWQGGHPEHDLVHVMTARAVRRLRRETGRPLPLVQCPAYEYVIACALRFKPLFRGDRRSIRLSPDELEQKRAVFDAYPSQEQLMRSFRRMVGVLGLAGLLRRGRRLTPEEYLSKEELGVVDPGLDYTKSTHRLEALNYMLDDFEGEPIRFRTMVRPIVRAVLAV